MVRTTNNWRGFCWTLNNPTVGEFAELQTLGSSVQVRYMVFQLEVGESGTPHYQGFTYFHNKKAMSVSLSLHPGRCHVEPAKGSAAQNVAYCTKVEARVMHLPGDDGMDSGPFEFGEKPPEPSHRTTDDTYRKVMLMIKDEGKCPEDILFDYPSVYMKYHTALNKFFAYCVQDKPRTERTQVYLLFGPPGTGKSHYAAMEWPSAFWLPHPFAWWDGYHPGVHDTIVIDEFRGQIEPSLINRLGDSTPMQVKIHGGFLPFRASRLVLISNFPPHEWWSKTRVPLDSFLRRITLIRRFTFNFSFEEYRNSDLTYSSVPAELKSFSLSIY